MTKPDDFLPFSRPLIDEKTIEDVIGVLRSGRLTGGPKVIEFEAALSKFCGGRIIRTFNSGTAALSMALKLLNIGPGDKVITTVLTWVATVNVIVETGAEPVFVDIDASTRTIDLDALEAAITQDTKAIIPVDLAGLPVNRDKLYEIANKYNLRVIEDAAQSFGSKWNQNLIGSFGDFTAFSFHANKNLTTGEGGALVLPSDIDVRLCERLRLQGVQRFDDGSMDVDVHGVKTNMSDIAAAIGLGQLKCLHSQNVLRRKLVERYFYSFKTNSEFILPPMNFQNSNWHMFQVLLPRGCDRTKFIESMKAQNIGIGIHYPAVHLFTIFRKRGFGLGDFPIAEDVCSRIVTLPLHPSMNLSDVDRVCNATKNAIG